MYKKKKLTEQFYCMKNFFITHKIYDEEDPLKFTRFWMGVYCRIKNSNDIYNIVDENGNKFISSCAGYTGGGGI